MIYEKMSLFKLRKVLKTKTANIKSVNMLLKEYPSEKERILADAEKNKRDVLILQDLIRKKEEFSENANTFNF